ncbi:MAG: hypothetical protein KDA62_21655, partial [Planctomycetales bacterium]|nr:hypothetical protein [Planctomycetales bacterium]
MASCLFHVTTKSVLFGYWFLSSLAIWQYASVALAADAFPPQAEPLFRDPQLVIDADGVPGETIVDLDISPDGERLAVSSGKQVRIYSLESGRLWKTLHGYREGDGISIGMIQKAKFSPSGRFLVVGITDNTELGSTRVYDLTRPEQLHRLVKGHTGCTKGVAFSPTGNLLATWSCDGTILLLDWDENQGDGVELARFSKSDPNGTTSRLPFPYFGFPLNDDWLVFSEFNPQLIVFDTRRRRLLKSNFEWPPELRQFLLSPNREWLNWRDSCVGDFRLDNPQAIVMSGKSNSSDGPARYWVDAWNSVEGGLKRT